MNWVTWQHVGVDRMACAWLIRRSIDPNAAFTFIPEGDTARPDQGEAFDLPGVRLSHRQGHSSFHTMLREYQINDPVLERIARIVDEADTVQDATLEPIAPGLDAICRGVRRSSQGDLEALERGALVFDALYAELSAELEAR